MKIVGIDGYRVTIHYNRGFYKILVIIYDSMTIYVKIVIYICMFIYIYIYTHVYSTPCNLGIISIREGWESRNVKTKASTHYDDILFAEARSRAGLPAEFVIENHHYGINY